MAGELQAQFPTGSTLYAVLLSAAGAVWNGSAFDATPTTGEWTTYAVTMAEDATSGCYRGDLPGGAGSGRFLYRVYKRVGGSAASTDPVVWTGEHDTRLANLDAAASTLATSAALTAAQSALSAAIAALNNLSSAQAQSAATAALNAYDPPTFAELTAGLAAADDATLAAIAALNNLSSAQAQTAAAAALSAYDPPTHAEMTNELATADDATLAAIAALPSVADVWAGITSAAGNLIADHVLRRTMANAKASSDGDTPGVLSLYGVVLALLNASRTASALTVKHPDGTTLGTPTVTENNNLRPVSGVDG